MLFIVEDMTISESEDEKGDDDYDEDSGDFKSPLKFEENGNTLPPADEKVKTPSLNIKLSPNNRSPADEDENSPLSDKKSVNLIKSESPSEKSPKVPISMVQANDQLSNPTIVSKKSASPTVQQSSVSGTAVMQEKVNTYPAHEPPAKMPRRDIRLEESAMARHQQMRYLDLLSRLFPEQKRGVIELILKGCNGDIVQAIECILPSHERAVAQMSAMPGQSFTLPQTNMEESTRQRYNANEKQNMPMSAFMPFNNHNGQNQHPTGHGQHGYTMVQVPPCPPGCTCQMSQKCPCPDCTTSGSSRIPHLTKHDVNGPKDTHSPSPVTTSSYSDIGVSPKEAVG